MQTARRALGVAALGLAAWYLATSLDGAPLAATLRAAARAPLAVAGVLVAYAGAFWLRALVWRRVVPELPLGQAWAALHVSLLGNHVLPFRLGEAMRVTSVVRRTPVPLRAAVASTLTLRAADLLTVLVLAAPLFGRVWLAVPFVAAVGVAGVVAGGRAVRRPGPLVVAGALAAWLLESLVMWQAAAFAGVPLSFPGAVGVTAATIAAQAVAVTPGGIGSYEAAATAAFVLLGAARGPALAAAVVAHALKTAYALVAGVVALVAPEPGWFGRLRLPRRLPVRVVRDPVPDGPVVLFFPAHDEEATVGDVVRRVPASVCGRPVRCLVVDDGSADATASVAAAAGASVVSLRPNRGLGAAVRAGLAAAVADGAAAVAFCDADGEYAPEELARLVAPILAGEADYVVGSRFAGEIRRMRPHRRLGNRVLTAWLRFVARRPVTDGQSGYRAFSRAAAEAAEVVHDYNYAQVLTLDLLGKGFRYAEVPIGYAFRAHGDSFVRLGRYLRAVVPAVHHELNG